MSTTNRAHKRVTLHDVAAQAGVSYQTVSRVINNDPHVSSSTRQRILRAVDDLNYQPNHAARSLVTRRSNLIEAILFGANHYGPSQIVAQVERAARRLGYNLILSYIQEMSLEEIRRAMDSLSGRMVDGILFITPVIGVDYNDLAQVCRDIPFVMVDAPVGSHAPGVVIHQALGSQLATQHLIDLGHREICEISGPLDWFDAIARHEGWQAALKAAGLSAGQSIEGDWTALGGYHAALRLLKSGARFSSLVVGNDQMALGVLRALREHGLRVPDDVSLVGFDDIPEAVCYDPPLTTIRQDFDAVGAQSVEYLVDLIRQPDLPPHQRILEPQLIIRSSTRAMT